MFLVILLYAILASTFTIAKTALYYAKPFFLIGFRMTIAGIFLLGYLYFFNHRKFYLQKQDWRLFLKVSLFHIYFAFIPEFWALQYVSSSKTNLIYSATPFIAALLSYFLLNEKLGLKKFLGMFIGLLGLIPIFLTQTDIREAGMQFFSISLPEIVLLFAVFSAAYAWFIVKQLIVKGYSLLMINGVAMLIGGILSFATSFIFEGTQTCPIFDFSSFLFWTLLLIIVANVIVYNFYGWLLKIYSITFVISAGFLCPIFGAFYGWFFLNEKITWHYFVSLTCVMIGLYLFYKQEIK
ncbi:EamA family transporter [Candidatus Dependentiae bacterium]|nr:EamA family transporter [Candidatus Dependentiae bacterium]